jgi:meiotically up-regulated gene 157 (Mug157) protein
LLVVQTSSSSPFAGAKVVVLDRLAELPAELITHRKLATECISRLFDQAASRIDDERIFISTGDIDAMWLRDSSFQIKPLLRFCDNPLVANFVQGVIASQAFYISIDPYANAFNISTNAKRWHEDFEDQSPWVFERKWEIDSLASFLDVSLGLAEASNGTNHLTDAWWQAANSIMDVFERETNHDPESYVFIRQQAPKHDWLYPSGRGADFEVCDLIWSAFRPSDDACELPFNVPQNAYAAAQLERLAKVSPPEFAARCQSLAEKIRFAIEKLALVDGVYAYEIDGKGGNLRIDDANIPSLLSLPYLGFCAIDDSRYLNTRHFALSAANPWFFSGSQTGHIGSPHTGANRVWPLAMAMEIITSQRLELDKLNVLAELAQSSDGLHESVDTDNVKDFTREWFSWAEMTFVDAVFTTAETVAR